MTKCKAYSTAKNLSKMHETNHIAVYGFADKDGNFQYGLSADYKDGHWHAPFESGIISTEIPIGHVKFVFVEGERHFVDAQGLADGIVTQDLPLKHPFLPR